MKKKLILLAAISSLLLCSTSCGKVVPLQINDTTVAATTLPETTTAEETTVEETTQQETTLLTTLPVTTTYATKTQFVTEQSAKTTAKINYASSQSGNFDKTETKTTKQELRYGVTLYTTTTYYFRMNNGTKEYSDETEESYSVNNTLYNAKYNDLLPYAKSNNSNYSSMINEILRITNEYRRAGGLKSLTINNKLSECAGCRCEEVAYSGKHDHYRPNLLGYFDSIFKTAGFTTGTVGENLGWGYTSAKAVCEAWKASPTHYENIMNEKFTQIGISVTKDPNPDKGYVFVQHFYGG